MAQHAPSGSTRSRHRPTPAPGRSTLSPSAEPRRYHSPRILDLARDALQDESALRLRLTGDSMAPFLRHGDLVFVSAVGQRGLRVGELVAFEQAGELVAHRLIDLRDGAWLAKGDNRQSPDPLLDETAVIGRIEAVERGGRRLDLGSPAWASSGRTLARLGALECRLAGTWPRQSEAESGRSPAGGRIVRALRRRLALGLFRLPARLMVRHRLR